MAYGFEWLSAVIKWLCHEQFDTPTEQSPSQKNPKPNYVIYEIQYIKLKIVKLYIYFLFINYLSFSTLNWHTTLASQIDCQLSFYSMQLCFYTVHIVSFCFILLECCSANQIRGAELLNNNDVNTNLPAERRLV